VTVRALTSGDEKLAEKACRLFGLDGDINGAAFLSRLEALLMVAEDEDQLVGWAYGHELIHPDGERTMLLYALDVAVAHRREGHGRQLVTAFTAEARKRGCTEVWVLTDDGNSAALAAYSSAGGQRDATDQVMFTWKLADGRHS
jgi:ribosomal protein S18 acetylase RimI-like enzyme